MKPVFVNWADIKADCQHDNNNEGLIFGIHWEDDEGQVVDAQWFASEKMRQDSIEVVTKDQVAAWIGSDNLSVNNLLELLTELANGEYFTEELKTDVLNYGK